MLVAFLTLAYGVWYTEPRLTPTLFPTALDITMLVVLIPLAFLMAWRSSVPVWFFTIFGAVGVAMFLFANFSDGNFRRNYGMHDLWMSWSAMILGGGVACRVIAWGGPSAWLNHPGRRLP